MSTWHQDVVVVLTSRHHDTRMSWSFWQHQDVVVILTWHQDVVVVLTESLTSSWHRLNVRWTSCGCHINQWLVSRLVVLKILDVHRSYLNLLIWAVSVLRKLQKVMKLAQKFSGGTIIYEILRLNVMGEYQCYGVSIVVKLPIFFAFWFRWQK
jgi:hypothetical protein